jgi:glucose-1-phosphate thymidylyltransferase
MVEVIEKPGDPLSILHTRHLAQPPDQGEHELSETIDLLIYSGRNIDAITLDGWQIDVGYPEDQTEAERCLGNDSERS